MIYFPGYLPRSVKADDARLRREEADFHRFRTWREPQTKCHRYGCNEAATDVDHCNRWVCDAHSATGAR